MILSSCKKDEKASQNVEANQNSISILRLDREVISGVGLKSVTNQSQPERRLYQKRLVRGDELSVYVVSSETATAYQRDYGMEEFIYLINGHSRMNPEQGSEVIFQKGDSFIAPKGFTGEWETVGGNEFLIELSIISTQREDQRENLSILPYEIDKAKRSGIGITQVEEGLFMDTLYVGSELTVTVEGRQDVRLEGGTPFKEQVIEVLSGKITITDKSGNVDSFVAGDFFMIPSGFEGEFKYEGHGLTRTMHIYKS